MVDIGHVKVNVGKFFRKWLNVFFWKLMCSWHFPIFFGLLELRKRFISIDFFFFCLEKYLYDAILVLNDSLVKLTWSQQIQIIKSFHALLNK